MKRGQQLLSFYLALCVAFAGAVGISPVLHVMVEHGGHGHTHSHAGLKNGNAIAEHAHPHPHPVPESQPAKSARIALPDHSPKLFGFHLSDVYRAVGGWIAGAVDPLPVTPVDENGSSHTHHSLAQMLLSGTVEGVADVPPLVCAPSVFTLSPESSRSSFVASLFDAQTASRGPPFAA